MNKKKLPSTGDVIASYRKRQQTGPYIIWGAAALLGLAGIVILVIWLTGPSKPLDAIFATDTPTPTMTFTPTNTSTPTETPTVTPTFTPTFTPTPDRPFDYIIEENDNLEAIAKKFNLGDNGVLLILALNPTIDPASPVIFVGQTIRVPNPGMELPTATPIPTGLPRGTKIEYSVQPGDTIGLIAQKFNSTVEAIQKENKDIEDLNNIFVGQILIIPLNLVTPPATDIPTATPGEELPTATATATP